MTISLKSEASGKPNLDQVFDPYVQGTHPANTSLLDDSGADIALRYAPIVYGTQALATGLLTGQSGHADINTLFAAYGTAVYSLPINGQTFIGNFSPSGNIYTSTVAFDVSNTGWSVVGESITSGAIPSNANSVQVTVTQTAGTSTPILTQIPLTVLSGSILTAKMVAGRSSGSPNTGDICSFVVVFYDSANRVISTTTFYGSSQV